MNDKERNEHFQGFAKLLQQELYDLLDQHTHELDIDIAFDHAKWVKQNQLLIAQRAYDLVFHLLQDGDPIDLDTSGNYGKPDDEDVHRRITNLPDLTEWPPTPQET
ncbi:MAG TPA: hypothetical protein VEL31_09175 [Ktedonobacteraceae bacterium]|nr:hypothetical protein [Ktedonobacteraceae bacterium]